MKRIVAIDGDVYVDANGYERVGKQYVHRLIAEKVLGRPLTGAEQVHHIDSNRSNNDPSNLVICPDSAYHMMLHERQRVIDKGGQPSKHKWCTYHKELHDQSEFSWSGKRLHNMCRQGTNAYRREKGLNKDKFDWKARLHQQYRRVFNSYTKREICKL